MSQLTLYSESAGAELPELVTSDASVIADELARESA